eukprot:Lithocolla_globosa_v1_NODE_518_length_3838_cov_6.179752.p1 type:complete len:838 gc:universal NODE_518_length_3838_cov_6.179752:2520-7(-)
MKETPTKSEPVSRPFRVRKGWWNDEVEEAWKNCRAAEKYWRHFKGPRGKKKEFRADFLNKRKLYDRIIQKTKRCHLKEKQRNLHELFTYNRGDLWRHIGRIGIASSSHSSIPMEVLLDDGTSSKDLHQVLGKWKTDFASLLSEQKDSNNKFDDAFLNACLLDPQQEDNGEKESPINANIVYEEVLVVMRKLHIKKAAGYDLMQNRFLKNETCAAFLLALFSYCFKHSVLPSSWLDGMIHPIPKDDKDADPRTPLNYRDITLLSCIGKMYSGILNNRLMMWAENEGILSDAQNGFRSNRGCPDHIYALNTIVQNRRLQGKSTYACFIDFKKAFDSVNFDLLWFRLKSYGVNGAMLKAIQSLYSNARACVRVNGLLSDWFPVTIGVKQGCLLSPLLFTLFVNDLAKMIQASEIGVKFGVDIINILLYADDIVLIAENENDLQTLLNITYNWCCKWRMRINPTKTKLVHFRPGPATPRSPLPSFLRFGNDVGLSFVSEYKYLGILMNEFGDFNVATKMLAASAKRALGALMNKSKLCGGMSYGLYTFLFHALVTPVMDYGSEIWGTKEYSHLDTVQHQAQRYFLFIPNFTANAALQGETGWSPPTDRHSLNLIRLWNHLISLPPTRLLRRIFNEDMRLATTGKKNWCLRLKQLFLKLEIQHNFLEMTPVDLTVAKSKLEAKTKEKWQQSLWNDERRRGNDGNKLRTYRTFKRDLSKEPYLEIVGNRFHRAALARLRCGTHDLRIERGRYTNPKTPADQRFCECCTSGSVEDEFHFLMKCSLYADLRHSLLSNAESRIPGFESLTIVEQFQTLMSNPKISKAASSCIYEMFSRRSIFLYSP